MPFYGPRNIVTDGLVFATDAKNVKSTTYQEDIVTDGLVFYTNSSNPKCTNGNATAIDLVGNNTGTLNGGMTVEGTDWTFDGVDEYIEFGDDPALYPTEEFTLDHWFNINSATGRKATFWTSNNSGVQGYGMWIDGTTLVFYKHDGVNWRTLSTSVSIDTWYHAVGRFSTTNGMELFLNGVSITSNNETAPVVYSSNPIPKIGVYQTAGTPTWFNGEISNVKVYDRELTNAEIEQNFNAGRLALLQDMVSDLTYTARSGAFITDGAWKFSGITDHLQFGTSTTLANHTGSFTFDVWLKTTFVNNLVHFIDIAGLGYLGYYRSGSTRHWRFLVDNNSWLNAVPNLAVWPVNILINLTGVYDSSTQEAFIYLDGELNNSSSGLVSPDGGGTIRIINNNNTAWQGFIYKAMIYTKALTASEVKQNYDSQKNRFGL